MERVSPCGSGGPPWVPQPSEQGQQEPSLSSPREKHQELSAGAGAGSTLTGPGEGRSFPSGPSRWFEPHSGML